MCGADGVGRAMQMIDWESRSEIECVRDIGRLRTLSDTHTLIHEELLRLKGEGKIDSSTYLELEKMRSEIFWTVYNRIAAEGGE